MNAHQGLRRNGFRSLQVEALEDRLVPAVGTLLGGVLTIPGNDSANTIGITQDDISNNIHVWVSDGPIARWDDFPSSLVTKIKIDAKGGDDRVTYKLAAGTNFTRDKNIEVVLGTGHDEADLDFLTGVNWLQDPLLIEVQGNDGEDKLTAQFARTSSGDELYMNAYMGNHKDQVSVRVGGDVYGDVRIRVEGGLGDDTLDVDCSEDAYIPFSGIDITTTGALKIDLYGGADENTLTATYVGSNRGGLYINSYGGNQVDAITTHVDLLNSSTEETVITARGGGGSDGLDMRVWNTSGTGSVDARIYGGTGFDVATLTSNVTCAPDVEFENIVP